MSAKPGVDYAALKKEALELAQQQGLRKRAISRRLGIGKTTIGRWLKEAGIEPLTTDTTEQRKEALRLAYMGVRPSVIKKKVGVSNNTVYKWLREAGFDTSNDADCSLPCPACGGRMEKQELFFWKCHCGAEWWPAEDMVPNNPDEWTTEAKLSVDPNAVTLIQRLLDKTKNYSEIAEALNQAGYKPAGNEYDRTSPGEWTKDALGSFVQRHELKGDYQKQRERVEQICKEMALKGFNCQEIANRLNGEGLRSAQMRLWTRYAVLKVIRKLLPHHKLSRGINTIPQVKLPERMKSDIHPWRRDEQIRYALLKARREHALHNLQGGHDVQG